MHAIAGRPGQLQVNGLVDQLEDRRLCKAEALGSNPSKSTKRLPHNGKQNITLITQR